MTGRIVFVTNFPDAADAARGLLPGGFEFVVAAARSAEFATAIADADYLVGFVDALIDEDLFAAAPRLKLVQLLSAGYDQADLAAARASDSEP